MAFPHAKDMRKKISLATQLILLISLNYRERSAEKFGQPVTISSVVTSQNASCTQMMYLNT